MLPTARALTAGYVAQDELLRRIEVWPYEYMDRAVATYNPRVEIVVWFLDALEEPSLHVLATPVGDAPPPLAAGQSKPMVA